MAQKLLSAGAKPAWGQGGPKPPTPRTPLEQRGREEDDVAAPRGPLDEEHQEEEEPEIVEMDHIPFPIDPALEHREWEEREPCPGFHG